MKRVIAFFLCALLVVSMAAVVSAESGADGFLRGTFAVNGNTLSVVTTALSADAKVTVTAGGEAVEDFRISTVEAENIPITYYCVMDTSSSLGLNPKKLQSDVLITISRSMREIDKMVLCIMGEEQTFTEPLTTAAECAKWIRADWDKARFTNLYEDVQKIIARIQLEQEKDTVSCLILMSDGLDDGRTAVTLDAANKAIRDANIYVCGISLVDRFPDTYAQNKAKIVEDFGKQSADGFGMSPLADDISAADAAKKAMEPVLNSAVVVMDTDQLTQRGDIVMDVAIKAEDGGKENQGSIQVPVNLLPELPTEPETEPVTAPVWTYVPEPTQAPRSAGRSITFYALIGGSVAAVLVILAIVILLTRRKEVEEDDDVEFMKIDENFNIQEAQISLSDIELPEEEELTLPTLPMEEPIVHAPVEEPVKKAPKKEPPVKKSLLSRKAAPAKKELPMDKEPAPQEEPAKETAALEKALSGWKMASDAPKAAADAPLKVSGCSVKLIGNLDHVTAAEFFLLVNESKTLGRSQRSDIVLNETDTSLSGVHFVLQWDGRSLHLKDHNSTNGTFINYVLQKPDTWVRLESGTTIRAGAYEYIVTYSKN